MLAKYEHFFVNGELERIRYMFLTRARIMRFPDGALNNLIDRGTSLETALENVINSPLLTAAEKFNFEIYRDTVTTCPEDDHFLMDRAFTAVEGNAADGKLTDHSSSSDWDSVAVHEMDIRCERNVPLAQRPQPLPDDDYDDDYNDDYEEAFDNGLVEHPLQEWRRSQQEKSLKRNRKAFQAGYIDEEDAYCQCKRRRGGGGLLIGENSNRSGFAVRAWSFFARRNKENQF